MGKRIIDWAEARALLDAMPADPAARQDNAGWVQIFRLIKAEIDKKLDRQFPAKGKYVHCRRDDAESDLMLACVEALDDWFAIEPDKRPDVCLYIRKRMKYAGWRHNDAERQAIDYNASLTALWSLILSESDEDWTRWATQPGVPAKYDGARLDEMRRDWLPDNPGLRRGKPAATIGKDTLQLTALRAVYRRVSPKDFAEAAKAIASRYTKSEWTYQALIDAYAAVNTDTNAAPADRRFLPLLDVQLDPNKHDAAAPLEDIDAILDAIDSDFDRRILECIATGCDSDQAIADAIGGVSRATVQRARKRIGHRIEQLIA